MQFKRIFLSLSIVSSLLAFYSSAQASDTGFYTGVRYGESEFHANSSIDSKKDISKDRGFKVLAGYKFSPRLSLRADYTEFGSPTVDYGTALNGGVTASSYGMSGVFHIPIPVVNPYAKIGVQKWTLDNSNDLVEFPNYFPRRKGTNLYYGFGAGIKIFPYTTLDFEYENYTFGEDNKMGYVSTGITINF